MGCRLISYYEKYKKIVLDTNVSSVPDYFFLRFPNVKEIHFSKKFYAKEGLNSLSKCNKLETIKVQKDTTYTVPSTVTDLSTGFGQNKYLKKLVIGKRVSTLFDFDIQNKPVLPNLTSISVNSGNRRYISDKGVLYSRNGKTLYYCPRTRKGNYTVKAGTVTIGASAFKDCKITNFVLPDSLKEIGLEAFANTAITTLDLPASISLVNGLHPSIKLYYFEQ